MILINNVLQIPIVTIRNMVKYTINRREKGSSVGLHFCSDLIDFSKVFEAKCLLLNIYRK